MMAPDDVSSAAIFAEYHRGERWRVLKSMLVIVSIVVVGGLLATGLAVANQVQHPVSGVSANGAGTPLTASNFLAVLREAAEQAKSGHFAMTVSAAGTTITMDGDFVDGETPADTVMDVQLNLPPDSISMKWVGGILYANLGAKTEDKFVAIDPKDPSSTLGPTFSALLDRANPANQWGSLTEAIMSVDVGGSAKLIDGVQATPYNVAVKTSVIASYLGVTGDAAAALPAELKYVYWVGTDNLVRKVTIQVAGATDEFIFSNWGATVAVTAPASDQIISIPGLN